jgi:hypothetical protein
MAKLKIFDNNNIAANLPSKDGYRNVAKGVLNNLNTFRNASTTVRTDLLKQYATTAHKIYQQTRNPIQDVEINANNCRVSIYNDERKKSAVTFGRHKMVLPEIQASDSPLTATYLDKYVQAIVELYYGGTPPSGGTPAGLTNASEFLFGIMLLTRCR